MTPHHRTKIRKDTMLFAEPDGAIGTVTFCLSGTATGTVIKWNQKRYDKFLGNNAACINIKKPRFLIILYENYFLKLLFIV